MKRPGDQLTDDELTAPRGMTRVVKSSIYPGPDIFVGDFNDRGEAIGLIKKENTELNDGEDFEHYAYDDKGKHILA